jgi:peptide/nickel transport system permease protein
MLKLILRRIIITLPVLILISLITFYLKVLLTSGVDQSAIEQTHRPTNVISRPADQNSVSLPLFYISILPFNFPGDLHAIHDAYTQKRSALFLRQGIQWDAVRLYLQAEAKVYANQNSILVNAIRQTTNLDELKNIRSSLEDSIKVNPDFQDWSGRLNGLIQSRHIGLMMIPTIHWNGLQNGYHQWLKKIVEGDWGVSSIDYRPAWTKIKEALSWTVSLNVLALFLIYFLGWMIGEYLFLNPHSSLSHWVQHILLFFHSIPRFFLAMILVLVFASNTIHPWLHVFPTPGFIDIDPGAGLWIKWTRYGSALILPLICMTLPSLSYLSRLYSIKLQEEKAKPYAFLAWAQGNNEKTIVRKHLRKNAIIPLLTLIGLEIPALIGGAVVIEVLFNIPGMGRLMMQSILLQDWVIVFDILLMTGVLTVLGKLITDVFIRLIDPRVK